jgi:acyl transferase domain-containing protein
MSDLSQRIHQLSPKRLALVALELEERLEALERRRRDPIAIVGMACRFPGGADSPDAFWRLLRDGVDAIREVPRERWDVDALYDPNPDAPGRMSTRWGGFLDACDRFDPDFFGISPREAQSMDPQQRLLLEVAWEALEAAGIAPDLLHGSKSGVFVGICNNDYSQILLGRDRDSIDAYLASGNAFSVASGRLSYLLGLQGPSFSVDTACSSSLVAVHLACQSLRAGECDTALAGGVNLILAPETTIALSKAHMMAPDGRCKTFDAAANGFVRGEGCGVIVLKRLSDALAGGDRVLAVIRGSAMNQDGRSSGLTAPNGPSQESVVGAALQMAEVQPAEVDYVESHGTGTSLGDPIEARALGAALGTDRPAGRPLLIGSVKTNIGHLESAAGIAGLIKAVLALQHEEIPAHLHFHTPNPHIGWASLPVQVATSATPWPRGERRRIAGVSSFGFSGTNAHVVLEEAPVAERATGGAERPVHVLTLSARTPDALRDSAAQFARHLQSERVDLADACFTSNAGRARFAHRFAVTVSTTDEAVTALEAFVEGRPREGLFTGEAAPDPTEVVFLFTGQGAQYAGMGRRLYETQPIFRHALDQCDELLAPLLEQRPLEVLYPAEGRPSRIDETAFTQPALFALEYALAELWRSWGIVPSVVMGHSVGEFAAACVAGVMSLEDTCRLIASRGRLMQALPAGGRMAAIFAPLSAVETEVRKHPRVAVAAVNGPENVVVSGDREAVESILAAFAEREIKSQALVVSHAFHSPLMAPMVDAFRREALTVSFSAPRIGFVSNLTGRLMPAGEVPDADYWCRHVMAPVLFGNSVETCVTAGYRVFLEVGPHPTLLGMARRIVDGEKTRTWLPSLRQGRDDWNQMLASAAELFVRGAPMDWARFDHEYGRALVSLPTYPFQRKRYWIPSSSVVARRHEATGSGRSHPLLGQRLSSPLPTYETRFDAEAMPVLKDHRVGDVFVVPGPIYLEMIASAASTALARTSVSVQDLKICEALVLNEGDVRLVQTIVPDTRADSATVQIFSADPSASNSWTLHASASVTTVPSREAASVALETVDEIRRRCLDQISGSEFYARVQAQGIEVGGSLRPIQHVSRRDGEALASLHFPESVATDAGFTLHPAILDSAMLVLGAARSSRPDKAGTLRVLSGIDRIRVIGAPATRVLSHILLRQPMPDGSIVADLRLLTEAGEAIALLDGIRVVPLNSASLRAAGATDDLLYDVVWRVAGRLDDDIAGDFLPPNRVLVDAADARVTALASEHRLFEYEEYLPLIDRVCAAYVERALRTLGVDFTPGSSFDANTLAGRLGVLPRHHRLLGAMLDMLEQDGMLKRSGQRCDVLRGVTDVDPDVACAALAAQHPAFASQARILSVCGGHLADVLRGEVDPLHLLFPNGSFELTEALYQHGPFARAYNTLVGDVVGHVVASLPSGRILRCIEIGAGTGGTTTYVLPQLPVERAEYAYTDLSKLFMTRAADKFRQFPFVKYQLLDIEQDPSKQGFASEHYDIVIASNVLHATTDLRVTLSHVLQLLAPGGLLLLLEGTERQRWVDLTFGLLEGWWKFTDHDVRSSYPLLTQQAWRTLLTEVGFVDVDTSPREPARQAVVLARAPMTRPVASAQPSPEATRAWLLVGEHEGLARQLAARLGAAGATVHVLDEAPESWALSLSAFLSADTNRDVEVVHVSRLGAESDVACASDVISHALAGIAGLTRALVNAPHRGSVRLWLVTSGAQSPTVDVPALRPLQATEWGFGRVIALEHPERWGGLIDLDPLVSRVQQATTLVRAVVASDGEDQVVIRAGVRYVPRLVRAIGEPPAVLALRSDATYLITGGTGGIAVPLARWMAHCGARHLLLTSRRGLPDRARWDETAPEDPACRVQELVVELEGRGVHIEVVACDVADEQAVSALLSTCGVTRPPLRGVMHAAAAMSISHVRDLDPNTLSSMLAPKVDGTNVLDRLTRSLDLDFFVLFSSTTALWGVAGLSHYAAANEYLDTVANIRASRGLAALSVNWGTWEEMRLATEEDRRSFAEGGLKPMASSDALDRLGLLISRGASRKIVASVDWAILKPIYEARRVRPFLSEVGAVTSASGAARRVDVGPTSVGERVRAAAESQRYELLVTYIQEQVGSVLGLPASEPIPVGRGFFDMGMDSLMSVELKSRLESGLQHALPSTLTFNYPNISALAAFIDEQLKTTASDIEQMATNPTSDVAIAITQSRDLDALSDDELEARLLARLEQTR